MLVKMMNGFNKSKNPQKIMFELLNDKRLTLKELVKKINIDESTVRNVLKKLIKDKIINFTEDTNCHKNNKLFCRYYLTNEGKAVFLKNFPFIIETARILKTAN